MSKPHWISNNICSNCWKGIKGYAIQQGYIFCPFCGERLEYEKEPAKSGKHLRKLKKKWVLIGLAVLGVAAMSLLLIKKKNFML